MIHPYRWSGRIRLLAAVFILLTAAASLSAKGSRESDALSRADELIANKEYDEAISLLSAYVKDNPDRFSDAQVRLQKIVRLREQYNAAANELLDTLETDPENSEKILRLSDTLLIIESPSNPTTKRFLDLVRYLAVLNVNKNRLERLLAAARERLNANDFSGALAVYASGLDIYQDEYFASGYGAEAEELAAQGLRRIEENIRGFNALTGQVDAGSQALARAAGSGLPAPAELQSLYAALLPRMEDLITLRKDFFDIRKSYDDQLAVFQAEDDSIGDRSFLAFAGRLITGPTGRNEGMTGTLERFWRFRLGQVEAALMNLAGSTYKSGHDAIASRNYSSALSSFTTVNQYIAAAREMVVTSSRFLETGDPAGALMSAPASTVIYGETIHREKAGNYLLLLTMDTTRIHLGEAANIGSRAAVLEAGNLSAFSSWQQGALEGREAISREQAIRGSYQEMIDELGVLDSRIRAEAETVHPFIDELANGSAVESETCLIDAQRAVANLASRFRTQAYNSAVRLYTIANGDLEKSVLAREAEFNEGNRLIQGINQTLEGETYAAYYPSEGLAVFTRMNLEADIAGARALTAQYAAENRETLDGAELGGLYTFARGLLDRLLSLQSRSAGITASARTQVERAASFRFEGDRLLQTARTAMNRNDFNTARTSLTRATEQYHASLAVQESDSLRSTWDTQLVRLGEEIVRAENEIVVRDVREMVTAARNSYYSGNMDRAEELLIRAQNRWRVTNITEQQEVEYWLGLVRGALSLQSGRVIASTAPLYAEMSQLLSEAKRSYDEGVRLLNSDRRTEGLARFNAAFDKTREVRLMFPMNQEARMLELRIEQQTDQAAFNASFQRRLQEAVAGTRPNVRSLESFAELQDLAEINPRYPGIAAVITQAEIDMGFRPPPPNPRDLARSTELTREAQTNVNSRDTTRYAIALTQLEEAIRLNPNNNQAQILLDQVSVLMTGTGRFVVSSNVMDRYNEAVQMYNQGNYLRANAIVQQLLLNPENQRSTLILELKRRIDAVL